jgi:hypothetical protein
MGLRRELRNPWVVAQIIAVILVAAWASPAPAQGCPDRIVYRVGDKFAFMGWTMHENEYDIEDFGGYRLWMLEVWKHEDHAPPEDFSLVREYVLGEDNPFAAGYWIFPEFYEEAPVCTLWVPGYPDSCAHEPIAGVRRDSAQMFQNAFPYEFSVTAFSASDPQANDFECLDRNRTGVVYPRVGPGSTLSSVKCLPNPYRASADWESGGERRVVFVGLPEKATIRIYTTSLAHVITLEHPEVPGTVTDQRSWKLLNKDDDPVAAGVYLYQVDAGSLGSIEGKVMIIK